MSYLLSLATGLTIKVGPSGSSLVRIVDEDGHGIQRWNGQQIQVEVTPSGCRGELGWQRRCGIRRHVPFPRRASSHLHRIGAHLDNAEARFGLVPAAGRSRESTALKLAPADPIETLNETCPVP